MEDFPGSKINSWSSNSLDNLPAQDGGLTKEQQAEKIQELLNSIPERERSFVTQRLGLEGEEPKSFDEIGEGDGIGRERARQVYERALRLLRNSGRAHLSEDLKDDYFDQNE